MRCPASDGKVAVGRCVGMSRKISFFCDGNMHEPRLMFERALQRARPMTSQKEEFMKRFIFQCGFALCAFTLAATPVHATSEDRRGPVQFETLDRDGDGQISREEIEEQRNDRFKDADLNGDGLLSLEEMQQNAAMRAKDRAEQMHARLDRNGDGFISAEEAEPGPRAERRFDRLDSDGDGAISKAEFESARTRMRERHGNLE
jgi:hypothetical protein